MRYCRSAVIKAEERINKTSAQYKLAIALTTQSLSRLFSRFLVQMKPVQQSVHHRGEENARSQDQCQAAVERVETREQLSAWCLQRSERPHAGENHRGIRE